MPTLPLWIRKIEAVVAKLPARGVPRTPLIAKLPEPGPVMVKSLAMEIEGLFHSMMPVTPAPKTMVSPEAAAAT